MPGLLSRMPSSTLSEWMAFYKNEADDMLQEQLNVKAAAGLKSGRRR